MARRVSEGKGLLLTWINANYLGVAAIGLLTLALPVLTSIRSLLVSSLIIGLPIGIAQWIASGPIFTNLMGGALGTQERNNAV